MSKVMIPCRCGGMIPMDSEMRLSDEIICPSCGIQYHIVHDLEENENGDGGEDEDE